MAGKSKLSCASLIALFLLSFLSCENSRAKDAKMLADTLARNFLAQQVTIICAAENKNFAADTRGPQGEAGGYADRVKEEIVSGLAADEAKSIIDEAASNARSEALELIRRLSVEGQVQPEKLESWCRTVGKPFVLQLESIYDRRHSDLERELNNAKH